MLLCLQSAYHGDSTVIELSDEDYINYVSEYNYNYEEDVYSENKKDILKQMNYVHSNITAADVLSDLSEQSIYHIDIFYMCTVINIYLCCLCKTAFGSNNKLHQYIQITHSKIKKVKLATLSLKLKLKLTAVTLFRSLSANIVESNTSDTVEEAGCGFWNWHYMTISFQFSIEDFIKSACLNTGCIMSLIDHQFLQRNLSDLLIQKSMTKVTVWGIGNKTHECQKYVQLNLYLFDILNGEPTMAHLNWDVHLVDELWAHLLIEMNIIDLKQISIDILSWKAVIRECKGLLTLIDIMFWKNDQIHQVIQIFTQIIISLQFMHSITVKTGKQSLSDDWDLVFNPSYLDAFSHIVDVNLSFIHIWNDLLIPVILFCHIKLEVVTEYKEEDCYTDSIENLELAALSECISTAVDMPEMCLFNSITIYKNKSAKVAILTAVMQAYLKLWHDHSNIISIFEINYLQVSLKKNWEATKLLK